MKRSYIHIITNKMLLQRWGEYKHISQRLGVSYTWIKDFANDRLAEPSAQKLENLYIMLYKDEHGVKPDSIPLK